MTSAPDLTLETVTLERDGHVLVMGLNRPEKRNAFTVAMLSDLARAYALLERDDTLRAGVLIAHGEHFTAGLDLVDLAPDISQGRDPWRLDGVWTKPVVAAAHGRCLTLGIFPFGGATIRLPRQSGWGNAMRWLLTGDEFAADAAAAQARARELAHAIADRAAPLGVQATLASAQLARTEGDAAAIDARRPEVTRLLSTADAAEVLRSFVARRPARFAGC